MSHKNFKFVKLFVRLATIAVRGVEKTTIFPCGCVFGVLPGNLY